MNRQENNMEQPTLWNMGNNQRDLGENSSKTQDRPQPRKDLHPQVAKSLSQNTSLTHDGNRSHPPRPMSRQLLRLPPPQTYLSRRLLLALLIGTLLPSPLGTPQTPAYPTSLTSRICVVANF